MSTISCATTTSSSRARRSMQSPNGWRHEARVPDHLGAGHHGEGHLRERDREPGRLPGPARRQQARDQARRRASLQSESSEGAHQQRPGKEPPCRTLLGPASELEESLRDARRRPAHRLLRAGVTRMPTILYKPTSPGRRFRSGFDFAEITRDHPEPSLLAPIRKSGGRNNNGRITLRHRGGGHKRRYRVIDFRRDKENIAARVASIEYDPNRSARLALLHYVDGEKRYILAPVGLRVGDRVAAGPEADIRPGNCLPLRAIPLGTMIHNIELRAGKGGQMVRSAGGAAQLMAKEGEYALVKLPSGEQRLVRIECRATVGQVGNLEHENISIGKAGRTRWLGRRSRVRGIAMNPVDHPHGGGEGRSKGNHPQTPWGMPTKGYKTRHNKRTNRFIVMRRKK